MIIHFEIQNSVRTLETVKISVSNGKMLEIFKNSYAIHSYNNKIWEEFKFKKIINEIRNYSTIEETLEDDILDYLVCFEFTRFVVRNFKYNNLEIFVTLNILNNDPLLDKVLVDNDQTNIYISNDGTYLSLIKNPYNRLLSEEK